MEGPGPTYSGAVSDYLLTLRAAGRSQGTIGQRRRLLRRFGESCGHRLAVGPSDVALFLADLQVSRNSLAQYAEILFLFFEHCLMRGWLPANPVRALPRLTYRPPAIQAIPLEDVRRALAVATPRQADIITILLATGLRVSELADARPSHADWERGLLRVRGKGGSQRTVALVTPVAETLRCRIGTLSANTIQRDMRRLAREARIPGLTAHKLRHTFAVTLLQRGARLDILQRLLGHRTLAATMAYLHYEATQEALDVQRTLNPAEGLSNGV